MSGKSKKSRAVEYEGDVRDSLVYGMSDEFMTRVMDAGAENGVQCRAYVYHGVSYGVGVQKQTLKEALGSEHFRILASVPNAVTADIFFSQLALALQEQGKRCRKFSDFFLGSLNYDELVSSLRDFDVIFVGLMGPGGREEQKRLLRVLSDPSLDVVVAFRTRYEDRFAKAEVLADHNPFEIDRDYIQYGNWDASVYLTGVYMSSRGVCRMSQTGTVLESARKSEEPVDTGSGT